MPVTKPTDLASWGSTSSNIVVPSAGAANPGFATGAQVPSGWLNWFMSTVSKWIAWLNAFESQAHTWTALQTLSLGLTVNGGATINGGLNSPNGGDLHGMTLSGSVTVTGGALVDTLTVTGPTTLAAPALTVLTNAGVWATTAGHPKPTAWQGVDKAVHIEGRATTSFVTASFLVNGTALPAAMRPASTVTALAIGLVSGGTVPVAAKVVVDSSGNVFAGSLDGTTNMAWVEFNLVYQPAVANGP